MSRSRPARVAPPAARTGGWRPRPTATIGRHEHRRRARSTASSTGDQLGAATGARSRAAGAGRTTTTASGEDDESRTSRSDVRAVACRSRAPAEHEQQRDRRAGRDEQALRPLEIRHRRAPIRGAAAPPSGAARCGSPSARPCARGEPRRRCSSEQRRAARLESSCAHRVSRLRGARSTRARCGAARTRSTTMRKPPTCSDSPARGTRPNSS